MGVYRCGYSVKISDPQVTCDEPYGYSYVLERYFLLLEMVYFIINFSYIPLHMFCYCKYKKKFAQFCHA